MINFLNNTQTCNRISQFYSIVNCVIISLFVSCTSNPGPYSVYSIYGNVELNALKDSDKHIIQNNDYFRIGKNSYSVIKNKQSAIICAGNTEIVFDQIEISSDEIVLSLKKGYLVIFSSELLKNITIKTDYSIVKGDFSHIVIMTENDAVAVWCVNGKGSVQCFINNNEYNYPLTSEKQFLLANNNKYYSDIPLHILDELKFNATLYETILNANKFSQNVVHDKLLSLSRENIKESIILSILALKKGKLNKVITYNGNVYKGLVSAKGKYLEIDTGNATVLIPQKQIRYVLQYVPVFNESLYFKK